VCIANELDASAGTCQTVSQAGLTLLGCDGPTLHITVSRQSVFIFTHAHIVPCASGCTLMTQPCSPSWLAP
jgi:hypothetical protein